MPKQAKAKDDSDFVSLSLYVPKEVKGRIVCMSNLFGLRGLPKTPSELGCQFLIDKLEEIGDPEQFVIDVVEAYKQKAGEPQPDDTEDGEGDDEAEVREPDSGAGDP